MATDALRFLQANYDALLGETDPLGDAAARFVIRSNRFERVNDLFEHLVRNDEFRPEGDAADVSPQMRDYLERSRVLPAWCEPQRIALGEAVYARFGPECMTALLFKALPAGYAHWHVAETLAITGRMRVETENDLRLTRRILETLQFVIFVMEAGGLTDPRKRGVTAVQKVRLIHATIRTWIPRDPRWQADWPAPLNQVELVMTMLTFSLLVIDGMRQAGVELEPAEEEAVLHLWKVVGSMLGLRDELQPADIAEARTMWALIDARATGATDAGAALTRALVVYGKSIMPMRFMDFVPSALILFYSGRERARLLGLKARFKLLQWLCLELVRLGVIAVSALARRWPWFGDTLQRFHIALLKGLLASWNEDYWHARKAVNFYIPPSLHDDWNIPLTRLTPAATTAGQGAHDDRKRGREST